MAEETSAMTDAQGPMSTLGLLADYFDRRAKQRTEAVDRLAAGFTERELRLIREAAVMGYVQGAMNGPHRTAIPPDTQIVHEVIDACLSHPDLYSTIATKGPGGREAHEEPAQCPCICHETASKESR